MENLTYTLDTAIFFWKNEELVAIEMQNGELKRYTTNTCTRGESLKLFGVDRPLPTKSQNV